MALDRKLDPITKDYVDDGAGGTEWTATAATAVHHQVLGRVDEWVGDPEAGSRLHQLSRKLTERVLHEATDAVQEALRPLVQLGWLGGVDVQVDRDQRGVLAIAARAEDIQGGGELAVTPLLPWGA